MCNFFTFSSDPTLPIPDRFKYFDWRQRQYFLSEKIKEESPDSHTSIAHFYGYSPQEEDQLNKYEYNPLTGVFEVDQINNNIDDSVQAEKWVRNLDFKQVVAPLIIKPILHPFKIEPPHEITSEILQFLRQWASTRDSAWASVRAFVGDSVEASVWDSVSVSIGASVWASVGASVRASVWDSVWAYISSFIDITYKHDLSPCIKLWEMGLVPSFDGKLWRLHGGPTAATLIAFAKAEYQAGDDGEVE